MARTSPTQRSLVLMRKRGWTCQVVERWNQFAMVRQDLYGFGDIICMKAGVGIALVQTTTRANMNARRAKIEAEPRYEIWRLSDGITFLHGWKKGPKDGVRGARKVWSVCEQEL